MLRGVARVKSSCRLCVELSDECVCRRVTSGRGPMPGGAYGVWLERAVATGGNWGLGACTLGSEVTFRGSRLGTSLNSTPIASGRRPIYGHAKNRVVPTSHAVKLAPAPLSIDPLAPHLRLPCGAVPPLLERAVMAAAAAMLSLERPSLSSSAPVLCLLITRHWLGSSTRCTLLLCVCGRIGFTFGNLPPHRSIAE